MTDGIYGFTGSTAQAYASANSIPFHTLYKVTLDSMGGSDVPFGYAVSGGTVNQPADPARSGYVFGGWYPTAACDTTAVSFPYVVTSDATLYAKWTPLYTVTFDSQGGSAVASQTVEEGFKAEKTADPVLSGSVFGGWYKDEALTAPWDFSADIVTSNMTLYAKWTKLELSSSVSGGKIYTGGRIVLTPSVGGGTWDWDHSFFSATFNSPAAFTALKTGMSTITYTVDGQIASYTVTVGEALSLSTADTDGKIYVGGRITLSPNLSGGAWSYDSGYLSLSGNTFTGLNAGTTTVTYTADGQNASYTVTIEDTILPKTGQDFTWVWILGIAAMAVSGLACLMFRKHNSRA